MTQASHYVAFVYGTLMFPAVLNRLLGRVPATAAAVLPGYARRAVSGQHYPAIVNAPTSQVHGLLLHDITPTELALLDEYEGDQYLRTPVTVATPSGTRVRAECFVWRNELRSNLSNADWSVEDFENNHLAHYLHQLP